MGYLPLSSYVLISSYISMLIALRQQIEVLITIGLIAIVQIILNLCFVRRYRELILSDLAFKSWATYHYRLYNCILIFSAIFSFQTYRLFYSRFMDLDVLFINFRDFNNLFKSLNYFSLLQMAIVQGIAMTLCVFERAYFNYTIANYVFIEESFILSLFLIISLYYEMSNTDAIINNLKNETQSVMLNIRTVFNTVIALALNAEKGKAKRQEKKSMVPSSIRDTSISAFARTRIHNQPVEEQKNEPLHPVRHIGRKLVNPTVDLSRARLGFNCRAGVQDDLGRLNRHLQRRAQHLLNNSESPQENDERRSVDRCNNSKHISNLPIMNGMRGFQGNIFIAELSREEPSMSGDSSSSSDFANISSISETKEMPSVLFKRENSKFEEEKIKPHSSVTPKSMLKENKRDEVSVDISFNFDSSLSEDAGNTEENGVISQISL
eukprot:TRINITY_DN5340_c0_g8_i2.p1 TRINITY_DN5340_c0_g8~~TRINITY_DN5340_c0_g8_i2.p1  ORF type:complete len:437 (-),score=15.31 TRINITY_DN5340_c0_g8_i2:66-1376(-)